ncbi:MAG: S1 RNA-binding domain-containing protein [Actinoplanes sp.]
MSVQTFLSSLRPGEVRRGTVGAVGTFGVVVDLDGGPVGTGFIRIPELSWSRIAHPADVVEVGQRVTVAVLEVDLRREQVALSLKALQEDPLVRFAGRVGEVVSGPVTRRVPFGVCVRVADGIEGLLHLSLLSGGETVELGETVLVRVADVDLSRRRVLLEPTP